MFPYVLCFYQKFETVNPGMSRAASHANQKPQKEVGKSTFRSCRLACKNPSVNPQSSTTQQVSIVSYKRFVRVIFHVILSTIEVCVSLCKAVFWWICYELSYNQVSARLCKVLFWGEVIIVKSLQDFVKLYFDVFDVSEPHLYKALLRVTDIFFLVPTKIKIIFISVMNTFSGEL